MLLTNKWRLLYESDITLEVMLLYLNTSTTKLKQSWCLEQNDLDCDVA